MNLPDINAVKTADEARELAIDYSSQQGDKEDLSYGELAVYGDFFEALAAKFPELKDEFKENAII